MIKELFRVLFAQMDGLETKYRARLARWLWPGSLAVLAFTVLYWTFMGTVVHMDNADQLADPRLFDSAEIFRGAVFPGAHTFLLKWPVFWLIALLHHSHIAFYLAGFALTGTVVALIVWMITKIEKRPVVRSALVLALASILLVIPAQPYAGALLPVNMAMLATRNIEYAFFILAVWFVVPSRRWWRVVAAGALLTVLFASDKLFVPLAVGGGGLMLLYGVLRRQKTSWQSAVRWLIVVATSFILATSLLWLLDSTGVTTIADSGRVSPYSTALQPKTLFKATMFAGLGTLTNFGAQPIDDLSAKGSGIAGVAREIMHLGLITHLVNLGLFVLACYSVWWLLFRRQGKAGSYHHILLLLTGAALAALGVFVLSAHYYLVDARYVAMTFFALFFALVLFVSQHIISSRFWVIIFPVLLLGIACGLTDVGRVTLRSLAATQPIRERNMKVAQLLQREHVTRLVGDYWRVFPIKDAAPALTITPLASCQEERTVLASSAWRTATKPYALLLSEDKGLTDFPACSFTDAVAGRGQPTEVLQVVPTEKLLIYR
jgi:hypothetical protein